METITLEKRARAEQLTKKVLSRVPEGIAAGLAKAGDPETHFKAAKRTTTLGFSRALTAGNIDSVVQFLDKADELGVDLGV